MNRKMIIVMGVTMTFVINGFMTFLWLKYDRHVSLRMTQIEQRDLDKLPDEAVVAGVSMEQDVQEEIAENREVGLQASYETPGGDENIGFVLTVDKDNVIVDARVEVLAVDETAREYQESFAQEFLEVLRGRSLSELENLEIIGGAHLTTGAFNESLDDLQQQL